MSTRNYTGWTPWLLVLVMTSAWAGLPRPVSPAAYPGMFEVLPRTGTPAGKAPKAGRVPAPAKGDDNDEHAKLWQ
jgi:hypothetical protein